MVEVDDSFNLIYKVGPEEKITFNDELLQNLKEKDFSKLPNNTIVKMKGIEFFELIFQDNKKVTIFTDSISCKFKDSEKTIKIFSFEHLKIILQNKINEKVYTIPYYYSNKKEEIINLNIDEIDKTKIYLEDYIEIKDNDTKDFGKEIKSIFNGLSKIYKEQNYDTYSYQFISPNFIFYFPSLKIKLTDKFLYIFAKNRKLLKDDINLFLDNKNPSLIYPICGPHGTGKTISALFFHKLYFQVGIRGIYLNLKYLLKDGIEFEEKIKALINECFFICDNDDELFLLYNDFITKKSIPDLFYILNNFIEKKNNRNIYNIENIQIEKNKNDTENNNKENAQTNKNKENIEMNNNKETIQIDQNKKDTQINKNKDIFENKNNGNIQANESKENIEMNNNKGNMQIEGSTQTDENNKNTETEKNKENIHTDKIENEKEKDEKNKIYENKTDNENSKKNQLFGKNEMIDIKENNNQIFIIIDQYQEKYNVDHLLDIFTNIKILLLSSINDSDVKNNIILKYKSDNKNKEMNIIEDKVKKKIIRYHYIDDLINTKYYEENLFKELIIGKIRMKQKDENVIKKEFDCIYNILKDLGFIPKYFFEYLYCYDSIYDLLFDEYSNIMKKLENFVSDKKMNIQIIQELINNKNLVLKDDIDFQSLNKNDFINKIQYVPLKYINFKKCANEEFYFYYSFQKFEEILTNFINFQMNKDLFYNSEDGAKIGIRFESFIKYQIVVYKKFGIDGYFEVNNLVNMDLTSNYGNINQEYIKSKKKIFINQINRQGKTYDFAIYLRESERLLLFQAKYLINNGNVEMEKSYYEKTAKQVLDEFNKLTKENVSYVHLLYISSIFYNYEIREKVINVLTNKRINCIFYSYITDLFYFNFKDAVKDLNLTISSMILPSSEFYTQQKCFYNSKFDYKEGIYFKYKNNSKYKKIKSKETKKSKKIENVEEEEEEKEEEEEEKEEKEKGKSKIKITIKRKENREFKEKFFLKKKINRIKVNLEI